MYKVKGNIIIILLIIFSIDGYAQFYSQENTSEAKDMVAICNSFTFLELYNSDKNIIPKGYNKTFTSSVFGMDNKYQIYQAKNKAVINLRGSTTKKVSWMENIYSSMVPAKDKIKIEGETYHYNFSNEENAGVHAGYTLSFVLLSKNIITNIKALNYDGIYDIVITGHSQGGALAILLRAYLENLPEGQLSEKNKFTTYAFANPKVGNQTFADAYIKNCEKGSTYSIVNVKDLVPKMPFSPSEHKKMTTKENFSKLLFDESVSFKDVAYGSLEKMFGGGIKGAMNYTSESALKQISKKVGEIKMPKHIEDVDYTIIGNRIELIPFEYPKTLKTQQF